MCVLRTEPGISNETSFTLPRNKSRAPRASLLAFDSGDTALNEFITSSLSGLLSKIETCFTRLESKLSTSRQRQAAPIVDLASYHTGEPAEITNTIPAHDTRNDGLAVPDRFGADAEKDTPGTKHYEKFGITPQGGSSASPVSLQ